jgi:hypothetical protein
VSSCGPASPSFFSFLDVSNGPSREPTFISKQSRSVKRKSSAWKINSHRFTSLVPVLIIELRKFWQLQLTLPDVEEYVSGRM